MPILDSDRARELGEINTEIQRLLKRLSRLMPEDDRAYLGQRLLNLTQRRRALFGEEEASSGEPARVGSCFQPPRSEEDQSSATPTVEKQKREPNRYEAYLLRLLQFQTIEELEAFLNGPSHPEKLATSEELEEQYQLAEREAEEEEEAYRTQKVLAKNRTKEKASRWKEPLWILSAVSTLFVLCGLAKMPYGYYMLLRTAVCLTAAYGFSKALDFESRLWLWVYGSIAVLSNPIFPVRLGNKGIWEIINIVTIVFFWIGSAKLTSIAGEEQKARNRVTSGLS